MPPRLARLAALGALGVALGTLAFYGLIAFISRPTPTGGIDDVQAMVTWIAIAVPIAAIVAVHVVYARVLARAAREPRDD